MGNRSFPFWTAPIIGAIAGAFFGFKAVARGGAQGLETWMAIAGCAAVGAFAGFLVALLDPRPDDAADGEHEGLPQPEISLVGRFILLLAVVLCWLPFIGAGFSAATLAITAGRTDWLRTLSYAAVGVSVLVHAAFVALLFMPVD
jgi:hypothetical protein